MAGFNPSLTDIDGSVNFSCTRFPTVPCRALCQVTWDEANSEGIFTNWKGKYADKVRTPDKAVVINRVVDGWVVHPRFESLSLGEGVIAHQPDVSKMPQPFRCYLMESRSLDVKAALEGARVPGSKTGKRVMAYNRATCTG